MAQFNMNYPKAPTGDANADIANLYSKQVELIEALTYALNHIGFDNMESDLISLLGLEEE